MKNLAERYEGYGGSIRRVMEVRDRVHGHPRRCGGFDHHDEEI